MIVENDEDDDEPNIEELGSAPHGRRRGRRRTFPWLAGGGAWPSDAGAERVSQVVRRASKREKLDDPRCVTFRFFATPPSSDVLADDGGSIQAIHIGLDADAPAADTGVHWKAATAIRADDQRVRGHARVSSCHAPAGLVVGANFYLVDVEAVPGDRVDAVLEGLPPEIPVRRLC